MDNQTSDLRGLDQLNAVVDKTAKYGDSIVDQLISMIKNGSTDNVYDLVKAYNISYVALGLTGEAGEIANKVKKILRDNNGVVDDDVKEEIAKELGDVLWYIGSMSKEIGYSLEEIIQMNHNKLTSRLKRGKISGSGDDR